MPVQEVQEVLVEVETAACLLLAVLLEPLIVVAVEVAVEMTIYIRAHQADRA